MKPLEREPRRKKELTPTPGVVDALRGKVEAITIDQGGEKKIMHVTREGAGQFGLTHREENDKWKGIFHHSVVTGRIAADIAERMQTQGHLTNPQRLIDSMIVSHAGRRAWEEARDFPNYVPDAAEKMTTTNETIGLRNIHEKIPDEVFSLVSGLAHGNTEFASVADHESLDYKIAIYVDHRTTDRYYELHERMGDFLSNNFFERGTVDDAKKATIKAELKKLIQKQKASAQSADEIAVPLEEADRIAAELGAHEGSARLPRAEFMRLILQDAQTEALLENAGIDLNPNVINDLPMPRWEKDIRHDYVKAAEGEIVPRIAELYEQIKQDDDGAMQTLQREFPLGTWWGNEAARLYMESQNPTSS